MTDLPSSSNSGVSSQTDCSDGVLPSPPPASPDPMGCSGITQALPSSSLVTVNDDQEVVAVDEDASSAMLRDRASQLQWIAGLSCDLQDDNDIDDGDLADLSGAHHDIDKKTGGDAVDDETRRKSVTSMKEILGIGDKNDEDNSCCCCTRFLVNNKMIGVPFSDPRTESRYLQQQVYVRDFQLMFLLLTAACLSSALYVFMYIFEPLLTWGIGWRDSATVNALSSGSSWSWFWFWMVVRVGSFGVIAAGHVVLFLGPRTCLVCWCNDRKMMGKMRKNRRRENADDGQKLDGGVGGVGGGGEAEASDEGGASGANSDWDVRSIRSILSGATGVSMMMPKMTLHRNRRDRVGHAILRFLRLEDKESSSYVRHHPLLSPSQVRFLELMLVVAACVHVVGVDFAPFAAAVSGNGKVYGYSGLLTLGNGGQKPFLTCIGAYSIVALTVPLRIGYLAAFTLFTMSWGVVMHLVAFVVARVGFGQANEPVGHLLGNIGFSLVIPMLLFVAASSNEAKLRRLFVLKERQKFHAAAAARESEKLKVMLAHVVPKEHVARVQENCLVLSELRAVASLELDIANFTRWSASKSSKEVIRCIHRLFTHLDRCGVGLKLRQAGDAWYCLSLPFTGPRGVLEMFRMAALSLKSSEIVNRLNGTRLEVRIGVGYSSGPGLLVAWGKRTKSLDYVGCAIREAVLLEGSSLCGHLHVREATLDVLVEEAPSLFDSKQLGLVQTTDGICLSKEDLETIVSHFDDLSVFCGDERVRFKETVVSGEEEDHRRVTCLSRTTGTTTGTTTASSSFASFAQIDSRLSDYAAAGGARGGGRTSSGSRSHFFSDLWEICRSDLIRISMVETVSRQRCMWTFVSSFIVSTCQLVDLFVSSSGPSLFVLVAVLSSVAAVLFLVFFVLFLVLPKRFLRTPFLVFSILVIVFRCGVELLVVGLCQVNFSALVRIICWDWTFPLLYLHINPFLIAAFLTLPMIPFVLLYLYSFSIDSGTDFSYAFEFFCELSLLRLSYSTFVGPISLIESFRRRWVARALRKVEEVVRMCEELRKSRSSLVSSFLPEHVRRSFVEGLTRGGLPCGHESVEGAVCYVKMGSEEEEAKTKKMESLSGLIERADLVNTQICALDDVVFDWGDVLKLKSSSDSYLCVMRDRTLQDLIPLALRFLSHREPGIAMSVGIDKGPFSAGIIGQERWCFDAVGLVINTAARLACAGPPRAICCRREAVEFPLTQKGLGFRFEEAGEAELKGIGRVELVVVVQEESS